VLALVGFGYVVATSWVFSLVFSGRGALIHTDALMATIMTANVFFVIMPNQRKSVAALMAGQKPDPKWVKSSKVRSTHNNYITLPVLVPKLSNHYPSTFSNPRAIPAILTCIIGKRRRGGRSCDPAATFDFGLRDRRFRHHAARVP
jgi:uncharacterized membrane protein